MKTFLIIICVHNLGKTISANFNLLIQFLHGSEQRFNHWSNDYIYIYIYIYIYKQVDQP